jgi:3-hydroxybutyryl-CoA dehydrogenase
MTSAGLCQRDTIDKILARIKAFAAEQEAVAPAQFVIEAIREDLLAKQELLARLETTVNEHAILASNSSSFPISSTASRMRTPRRAIVTHWFNPPHIVPTVEVVPGERTDEKTTEVTLDLLRRVGKLAVRVSRELPGFLVNRVQNAIKREVWALLDKGVATAEDIDAAIRGSIGFRLAVLGPLEVNDFCGLDIETVNFRNLVPTLYTDTSVPARIQQLIEAGHLGVKTAKGFYDYPAGVAEQRQRRRDALLLAIAKVSAPTKDVHEARRHTVGSEPHAMMLTANSSAIRFCRNIYDRHASSTHSMCRRKVCGCFVASTGEMVELDLLPLSPLTSVVDR